MTVSIINADVMDGLRGLPDESVHCVVTSPPYWGLRDYGTGTWEGGEDGCDHVDPQGPVNAPSAKSTLNNGKGPQTGDKYHHAQKAQYRGECGKCGARRVDRQIGLEPTPDAFVSRLVEVFREVRRVLRKDGTCWVNLGDSYAGRGRTGGTASFQSSASSIGTSGWVPPPPGFKQKDLVGIPWRVALALQADGWYLRQDIIWAKPNPMPESVTDRCTKAHEYVFMLTKSARYFYDQEAIAELALQPLGTPAQTGQGKQSALGRDLGSSSLGSNQGRSERNKRSVWTIATAPFSEAHFATFPPELPEICIKAGCPKGGTVLDPFGGAGTTGLVADRLQRNAVLIELNPEYAAMARKRIGADRGALLDVMEAAE